MRKEPKLRLWWARAKAKRTNTMQTVRYKRNGCSHIVHFDHLGRKTEHGGFTCMCEINYILDKTIGK